MRRFLLLCGMVLSVTSCTAVARPPVDAAPSGAGREEKVIGGGHLLVSFEGESGPLDRAAVEQWIDTAANSVTAYFGHYPVKRVELIITFDDENNVHDGVTHEGHRIDISVGRKTPLKELGRDWMLTHEMFHLAFPGQDRDHHWMEEGLSVYLEPLARVRIGNLSVERYWRETVEGMPQGLPEAGDRGLDQTHTWGRTYWGGAIFWMTADVRIREQTQNRKSLDTAMRAILEAGGDGSATWSAKHVMEAGDAATGTHVLQDLYAEMALKPAATDLAALWKKLGVTVRRRQVTFDDTAPLAEIRRSMTARPADH